MEAEKMNKAVVTVESDCRIKIPPEISETLGIVPGMKLAVFASADSLLLEPLPFRVSITPLWRARED
jgi:bifunctional DNA-binding transcriptional regulator/antitoxin component of YhaV-PrlF toxin-antitoxin module